MNEKGYNEFFPHYLHVRILPDGRTMELLEDFIYLDPLHGTMLVPKGYKTDLASVPRLLWALFPPFGRYAFAAVIHDKVYGDKPFGRTIAGWRRSDRTMWRAMKLCPHRVNASTRVAIYLGLLCGGWVTYFFAKD